MGGFSKESRLEGRGERFSEQDVVLVTYGDMIHNRDHPLRIIADFAKRHLKDGINTLHVLPFFRYDSDRGFSITNYREVDPRIGDWCEIAELRKEFRLMFDLLINHVSDKHPWFQEFKKGTPKYRDYFIWFDRGNLPPEEDLRKVFRPRATPLLTKYDTSEGEKYVWTTFPLNQVDLNFKNEEVLAEIVDTMLFYVSRGADILRLDAIAFLWKELGTSCVHLKQTHIIVQLLRDVLEIVAPHALIITETNVPHKENVEYFGDGSNEAHMVYNFALPPLVIHALYSGDATRLSEWADKLETPSEKTAFLNSLDSHDGVGVLGVKGVLSDHEIEEMVRKSEANGGLVSYKKNPDGSESPYEMNTTWWSALKCSYSDATEPDMDTQIRRYLVSRSIALCLKGVPAIYLNGLLGALNDRAGAERAGCKRDINRKNLSKNELLKTLENRNSRMSKVFYTYLDLLEKRVNERAFHPNGDQKILFLKEPVFSLVRTSPDGLSSIIAVHNLSHKKQGIRLERGRYRDMISQREYHDELELQPYQVCWLKSIKRLTTLQKDSAHRQDATNLYVNVEA